jgi:hypothetical protein
MRRLWRQTSGNALIFVTACFGVLAAFGILTVDIGRIVVTRSQLQNAADAGALAGASLFCTSSTPTLDQIQSRVRLVGERNMALSNNDDDGRSVTVTIPNDQITVNFDDRTVAVETNSSTSQYFLGLVLPTNITEKAVKADALAGCGYLCGVRCLKPWSIPDRWDDQTAIPGYASWRNNKEWDNETFTDRNGNRLHDAGEPYEDRNTNGQYDEEFYHQLMTGFVPDPTSPANILNGNQGDIGLEMTLKGNNDSRPQPGQYFAVDYPPINKGTPVRGADQYRENIAGCTNVNNILVEEGDELLLEPGNKVGPTNQGMRALIAQDPNARWDAASQSVVDSAFPISPRIVYIPIHDPRIQIQSGRNTIIVTKIVAFFMERMTGSGEVQGRFLKVRGRGEPCATGPGQTTSGSFVYSLKLVD